MSFRPEDFVVVYRDAANFEDQQTLLFQISTGTVIFKASGVLDTFHEEGVVSVEFEEEEGRWTSPFYIAKTILEKLNVQHPNHAGGRVLSGLERSSDFGASPVPCPGGFRPGRRSLRINRDRSS